MCNPEEMHNERGQSVMCVCEQVTGTGVGSGRWGGGGGRGGGGTTLSHVSDVVTVS